MNGDDESIKRQLWQQLRTTITPFPAPALWRRFLEKQGAFMAQTFTALPAVPPFALDNTFTISPFPLQSNQYISRVAMMRVAMTYKDDAKQQVLIAGVKGHHLHVKRIVFIASRPSDYPVDHVYPKQRAINTAMLTRIPTAWENGVSSQDKSDKNNSRGKLIYEESSHGNGSAPLIVPLIHT